MNVIQMIIGASYITGIIWICDRTIWGNWFLATKNWGWKEWAKWFANPRFYLGLVFIFLTFVSVMKTVRDLWFQ